MPLLLDQSLPNNTRLLVWDISEETDWLKSRVILDKEEEDLYLTFTHDPRRKQWLSVRLLLQHYFAGKANQYLYYDEFHKPYLKDSNFHISISHSHQLAGIIISESIEPGLDIEKLAHGIEKIKNRFLSDEELHMIKEPHQKEQLHIYWCAKEVMYKIYGRKKLEFKENLKIVPYTDETEGRLKGQLLKGGEEMNFDIYYRQLGGYMIAWGYEING